MIIKPANFFLRELPDGFDRAFLLGGDGLPRIEVLAGALALASTEVPPQPGSTLTALDTLIFDPTPDAHVITLQTRLGGGWEALDHDIGAEPYVIPAAAWGRSYRLRATATAEGHAARTITSNSQTVPVPVVEYVTHLGEPVTYLGEPVWVHV